MNSESSDVGDRDGDRVYDVGVVGEEEDDEREDHDLIRRVGGFSNVDEEDFRDVEGREEDGEEWVECEAPISIELGPTRG